MVKVKCVFGYKGTWQNTEERKARVRGQELTLGPALASTASTYVDLACGETEENAVNKWPGCDGKLSLRFSSG